jgi:hypothetical protein
VNAGFPLASAVTFGKTCPTGRASMVNGVAVKSVVSSQVPEVRAIFCGRRVGPPGSITSPFWLGSFVGSVA